MLILVRKILAVALWLWAVTLFVLGLVYGHLNILGPLLLVIGGIWLWIGPQKVLAASRSRALRYEEFLQENPKQKRLEVWSKWLRWLPLPLIVIWTYFAIENLSDVMTPEWIVAVGLLLMLPGFVLSLIPIWNKYQSDRKSLVERDRL